MRRRIVPAGVGESLLQPGHGGGEVAVGSGPARGMHPRRAAEGVDAQARVIGDGDQATGVGGGPGLDQGVAGEGRLRLIRLGQAEIGRGDHLEAAGEQGGQFPRLAAIVGGGHQPGPGLEAQGHAPVLRPSR